MNLFKKIGQFILIIWKFIVQDWFTFLKWWGFVSFLATLTSAILASSYGSDMQSNIIQIGNILSIILLCILIIRIFLFVRKEFFINKELREMVNNPTPFDEYDFDKYSNIPLVGIIGLHDVGKTSLIEEILDLDRTKNSTTGKYIYVHGTLVKGSMKYMGFLDGTGGGSRNSIQLEIIRRINHLIIMLDHNESDKNIAPNNDRLDAHTEFTEQVIDEMNNRKIGVEKLFLLFNKNDLWEQNQQAERDKLIKFFQSKTKEFSSLYPQIKTMHFNTEENKYRKEIKKELSKIIS